jgi:ribosomal protein S24E
MAIKQITTLQAYKSFLKGIRMNSIALNKLNTNKLVDRNEIKLRIEYTKAMLTDLNRLLKQLEQENKK